MEIKQNNIIISKISEFFLINKYLSYKDKQLNKNNFTAEKISTVNDFYYWLQIISEKIFKNGNNINLNYNYFLNNILIIGNINLLQYKIKEGYSKYNSESQLTDNLYKNNTSELLEWGKYSQNNFYNTENYHINGDFGTYSSYGYKLNIGSNNSTYQSILNLIQNMKDYNYIDNNTIAVSYIFNGYFKKLKKYFFVNILVEKNNYSLTPSYIDVNLYMPTIYHYGKKYLTIDIFIIIFSFAIMAINIYTFYLKRKKYNIWLYLLSFDQLFLVLYNIIFLIYLILWIIHISKDYNNSLLYNTDNYNKDLELRNISSRYQIMIKILGIKYGLTIIVLIIFLTLKLVKKSIINILRDNFKANILYLILLMPILLGLSYFGHLILGVYDSDFSSLRKSFISIIMATMGRINPDKILDYNSSLGVFVYILIYFTILIFTLTIYLSLNIKSYYNILRTKGYYFKIWKNLTVIDYLDFFLFFLPDEYYKKKY